MRYLLSILVVFFAQTLFAYEISEGIDLMDMRACEGQNEAEKKMSSNLSKSELSFAEDSYFFTANEAALIVKIIVDTPARFDMKNLSKKSPTGRDIFLADFGAPGAQINNNVIEFPYPGAASMNVIFTYASICPLVDGIDAQSWEPSKDQLTEMLDDILEVQEE